MSGTYILTRKVGRKSYQDISWSLNFIFIIRISLFCFLIASSFPFSDTFYPYDPPSPTPSSNFKSSWFFQGISVASTRYKDTHKALYTAGIQRSCLHLKRVFFISRKLHKQKSKLYSVNGRNTTWVWILALKFFVIPAGSKCRVGGDLKDKLLLRLQSRLR